MESFQLKKAINDINQEMTTIKHALEEVSIHIEKVHIDLITSIEPSLVSKVAIDCPNCTEN